MGTIREVQEHSRNIPRRHIDKYTYTTHISCLLTGVKRVNWMKFQDKHPPLSLAPFGEILGLRPGLEGFRVSRVYGIGEVLIRGGYGLGGLGPQIHLYLYMRTHSIFAHV